MKLCFVINNAGYFALHWLDRARAAVAAGAEVWLLSPPGEDAIMAQILEAKLHWQAISLCGPSRHPLNLLRSYREVSQFCLRCRPDIVHAITLKPILIGAGLVGRGQRTVLSFPGLGRLWSGQFPLAGMLRRLTGWWLRRAARQSHCLLTFEHEGDRRMLVSRARLPISQTRVTGVSGVDPVMFAFSPLPFQDPPVVLFAARLLRAKGLEDLVRMCRKIRAEGVPLRLRVAGLLVPGDADGIPLQELVRLHEHGEIEWLGSRRDMPALIAQATVVALPSRYAEGVPRILIEAASCGRPSVAYDKGGCRLLLSGASACGLLALALRRLFNVAPGFNL
ncbi:glycosyltransferase [Enterobacter ludwigii]|uniref:glycosyltransferase n=1 Tax=Enterobacter ludwigii TaxID=299767 RepID=UPI003F70F907